MRCSIIIPAYNEAKAISDVIQNLRQVRPEDEIIVIDDGSKDNTAALAQQAGARVIKHNVNTGYGSALKTGIRHASSEIVVFFDADGQHNPQDIEALVQELTHCDMVVGARPKGYGAIRRRSGKWFLYRVAEYLVSRKIPDLNSGLRAVHKETALAFMHLLPNGFSLTTTITLAMMRSGYQVHYLPIEIKTRIGKSTVSLTDFFRTLLLITRMITLFAPLKIYLPFSGILLIPGFISLAIDVQNKNLTDTTVILWLFSLIIFLFGLMADAIALTSRKGVNK